MFVLTPAASPGIAYVVCFALRFFASGQAGGLDAYLAESHPDARVLARTGVRRRTGHRGLWPAVGRTVHRHPWPGQRRPDRRRCRSLIALIVIALLRESKGRNMLELDTPADAHVVRGLRIDVEHRRPSASQDAGYVARAASPAFPQHST